jgi:hypothetical protein
VNLGLIGAFDHPTSVILKAHSDLGAAGWLLDHDMAHPLRAIPGVMGVYTKDGKVAVLLREYGELRLVPAEEVQP